MLNKLGSVHSPEGTGAAVHGGDSRQIAAAWGAQPQLPGLERQHGEVWHCWSVLQQHPFLPGYATCTEDSGCALLRGYKQLVKSSCRAGA